jgi:hypothetical protein
VWRKAESVEPVCFHSLSVWKDSLYMFGGLGVNGKETNNFYEFKILNKTNSGSTLQPNLFPLFAEGPFYVLLGYLDAISITNLSSACRLMRQRWWAFNYTRIYLCNSANETIWKALYVQLSNELSYLDVVQQPEQSHSETGGFWKRKYAEAMHYKNSFSWSPVRRYIKAEPADEIKIAVLGCCGVGNTNYFVIVL